MRSRMILINYLILPIKMIVINIVYEKYDKLQIINQVFPVLSFHLLEILWKVSDYVISLKNIKKIIWNWNWIFYLDYFKIIFNIKYK